MALALAAAGLDTLRETVQTDRPNARLTAFHHSTFSNLLSNIRRRQSNRRQCGSDNFQPQLSRRCRITTGADSLCPSQPCRSSFRHLGGGTFVEDDVPVRALVFFYAYSSTGHDATDRFSDTSSM